MYCVIPSSTHEVLILPYDKEMSKEGLDEMVREVNGIEVKGDEILSDKVFFKDDKLAKRETIHCVVSFFGLD